MAWNDPFFHETTWQEYVADQNARVQAEREKLDAIAGGLKAGHLTPTQAVQLTGLHPIATTIALCNVASQAIATVTVSNDIGSVVMYQGKTPPLRAGIRYPTPGWLVERAAGQAQSRPTPAEPAKVEALYGWCALCDGALGSADAALCPSCQHQCEREKTARESWWLRVARWLVR